MVWGGCVLAAAAVAAYSASVFSPVSATSVVEAIGHFGAALCGAVCLGGLVLVLITAQPDDRGVLDPTAFRAHLVVERFSLLWALTALTMVVVQTAADAGVSAIRLLGSGRLGTALGASETGRGWVAVAIFAAVLAVFSRMTVRWEWHVPLMIPAVIGVVAVPVTGSAGQGPNHDYATSSVIVFALAVSIWSGVRTVSVAAPVAPALRRRVEVVAASAGSVALAYGMALILLRVGVGNLTSAFGWLALIAAAALAAGVVRGGVLGAAAGIAALAACSLNSTIAAQPLPMRKSSRG